MNYNDKLGHNLLKIWGRIISRCEQYESIV